MAPSHERVSAAPVPGSVPGMHAATLWAVVLPVKRLARAKSRLAAVAGDHRERLALALATDTVSAALSCSNVRAVLVVTDDPLAAPTLKRIGAQVVPDVPDSGLNPALRHGATVAAETTPGVGVVALSADLPALRPVELDRTLDAAADYGAAFVADAAGTGTTLYAAKPGHPFTPEFGVDSRDRHTLSGAYELTLTGVDSVRRDVDTPSDLEQAVVLGVGPRTASALQLLRDPGNGSSCP